MTVRKVPRWRERGVFSKRKELGASHLVKPERRVHEHELSNGVTLGVYWVPTPSGTGYCLAQCSLSSTWVQVELDDGHIYGTYEEVAALYTRIILDDDGTGETGPDGTDPLGQR